MINEDQKKGKRLSFEFIKVFETKWKVEVFQLMGSEHLREDLL
jgi:hypothetical protein